MRNGQAEVSLYTNPSISRPLSLDRVKDGQPVVSDSRLLKMPVEFLAQLIQHLQTKDLCSLAFVNSDCRQLARSELFKHINFDYSSSCRSALSRLCEEPTLRAAEPTRGTYLGSCVRVLKVRTDPDCLSRIHNSEKLSCNERELNTEEEGARYDAVAESYFENYLCCIETAVSNGALPYLEILDWDDVTISLPRSFYTALISSPINHLRLRGVSVSNGSAIRLSDVLQHRNWPLRSLFLHTPRFLKDKTSESTRRSCSSILHLCHQNLEILSWGSRGSGGQIMSHSLVEWPQIFPCLRQLELGFLGLEKSDSPLLDALLGPQTNVRELQLIKRLDNSTGRFIARRGYIRTLETFSAQRRAFDEGWLGFLQANNQLKKLSLTLFHTSTFFLELLLLPLLTASYHSLTSLRLYWPGFVISEYALEQISALGNLSQLCLNFSEVRKPGHGWWIDHTVVQKHLSRLRNLTALGFFGDAYKDTRTDYIDTTRHIESNCLIRGLLVRRGETNDERGFNYMAIMSNYALQYADILPLLEWVHIGRVSVDIERDDKGIGYAHSLWDLNNGIGWDERQKFMTRRFDMDHGMGFPISSRTKHLQSIRWDRRR